MIIIVQSSFQTFKIECPSSLAVDKFRSIVADYLKTKINNILLFFNGRLLKNNELIQEIQPNQTVNVTCKLIFADPNFEISKEKNKMYQDDTPPEQDDDDAPSDFEDSVKFIQNLGFSHKQAKIAFTQSNFSLVSAITSLVKSRPPPFDVLMSDSGYMDYNEYDDDPKDWSIKENIMLFRKRIKFGNLWGQIHKSFPNKTMKQIKAHWYNFFYRKLKIIQQSTVKRISWIEEEQELLPIIYAAVGKNIEKVKPYFNSRTANELRLYWEDSLKPLLRYQNKLQEYENVEDDDMVEGQEKLFGYSSLRSGQSSNVYSSPSYWTQHEENLFRLTVSKNGFDMESLKIAFPHKT